MNIRRTYTAITWLLLLAPLGFGIVIGMMFTLPLVGKGDAALNFLGSLFGAAFASAAAILAVEWQGAREERDRHAIVIDLLRSAEEAFGEYSAWIDAGAPAARQAMVSGPLVSLVGSTLEALEIARELRSSTSRMARVALLLGHEVGRLDFLDDQARRRPQRDIGTIQCQDAVGAVITAVRIARQFLEH